MSDEELDKVFQEAAAGYTPPQDARAWDGMAKRLDKVASVKSSFLTNWKYLGTITVLLLTSSTAVWYFATHDGSQGAGAARTELANQIGAVESEINSKQEGSNARESFQDQPKPALNEGSDTKIWEQNLSQTTPNTSGDHQNVNREYPYKKEVSIQKNRSGDQPGVEKTADQIVIVKAEAVESNDKLQLEVSNQEMKSVVIEDEQINSHDVNKTVERDSIITESSQTIKLDSSSSEKKIEQESIKPLIRPVFSIRASLSPDFSSINFFTPDRPGLNYGIMVGYSINRWSFYTGVISSRKIYTSSDIEEPYTSGSGYDYDVEKLSGDCRVLDIPVNVYYTILPNKTIGLRAGIGISSYIMKREDYVFHVDNHYGPSRYTQRIRGENKEWFKVLNVSLVIQRKLNEHFFLELEPFVKAPLAGVGEGEVSLVSLGAFFNLRYDLPLTKQK